MHVDFSYNWFDGSLSTQFVHCTKLKSLAIMENFLSGDINHVLGNLPTTLGTLGLMLACPCSNGRFLIWLYT